MELRLGFLASGRGSNVEAILSEIETGSLDASARVVISNNPDARVLSLGKRKGIPSYCLAHDSAEGLDQKILEKLRQHKVNLVILAGYLKKVGVVVIKHYQGHILNIHPSLLPLFGGEGMYGMRVHEAVISSGVRESGATIHLVTEDYDQGEIIAQYKVPVFGRDTPETLADRVLRIEHVLYPQTLREIQKGIIVL